MIFSFSSLAQTPLYGGISVSDTGSNNNLGSANTSRNVAIDLDGIIYVVYANPNQVRIAKSTTNGQNFLPSVLVANASDAEPEIAVNSQGNVFIAWIEGLSIYFTLSTNGGVSFSAPEIIGSAVVGSKIHMTTYNENVYLTERQGNNVYYNNNNGVGGFMLNPTGLDMVFADVLTDQNGVLYVPMDDPDLVLFESINEGATITQTNLTPAGQVYFSSYALSDGPCGTFIFVGGGFTNPSTDLGYKIDVNTGITTELTLGLNSTTAQARTLYADNQGTLIDGYRASNGDLMISVSSDQGNSFDPPIVVANGESHNIGRSPTTDNISIVYESNGEIFLSVYDNILKNIELLEPNPPLSLCSNESFDISFVLTGIFSSNSVFSASLSDENGDFTNATEIGSVTTNANGTITCTIPNNVIASSLYRLQIESLDNCMQSNIINLTVNEGSVSGVSEICEGETTQLSATGMPAPTNPWISSDTSVATIDNSGLVTAIGIGTSNITYSSIGGCSVIYPVEVLEIPTVTQNISFSNCETDINGNADFDTSNLENTLLNGQTGMTLFYTDENGNPLPSPLPNPFNSDSQTITVRVENSLSATCFAETTIDFIVNTNPTITAIPVQEVCDDDSDDFADFDTSIIENTLLNGQTGMTVFYTDENGNPLPSPLPNPFNSDSQTITVSVENSLSATCFSETTIDFIVNTNPTITTIPAQEVCDDDTDGFANFDTSTIESTLLNGQTGMTVFYTDENGNALPSPLPNPFNSDTQTISVRVENSLSATCFAETTIDFIVNTNPTITAISAQEVCDDDTDGFADFDTSNLENMLLSGQTGMTVFYTDENGNSLPSPLPNPFNSDTQTITVRVENSLSASCFTETTIGFIVNVNPTITTIPAQEVCDDDTDGFADFDTSIIENTLLNGQTGMTISYTDENGNPLPSPLPNPFNSDTQTISVRVENSLSATCFTETTIDFIVNVNPTTTTIPAQEMCDNDTDGFADFDTSTIENTLLNGQTGMTVFYTDENGNSLPSPLPNPFNSDSQTITVRVENSLSATCFSETTIDFIVRQEPIVQVDPEAIICMTENPSLDISVINPNPNYIYLWTDENGNQIGSGATINVSNAGLFNVSATLPLGCITNNAQINVTESNIPVLTINDITINENLTSNSITINTSNLLPGDYEFGLLDENLNTMYNYQREPFFDNLDTGLHTILVRDLYNCGTDEVSISILNFPNFFTPNEDGINDVWTIEGFNNSFYPSSSIHIYNRYGKVMAELPAENPSWNGTFKGKKMPSTDYWYLVLLTDIYGRKRKEKGHFSLLRR
ncbi:T9SS type B sorting domain-containing protein [Tenacibaculum aquimarinum]|uniref:T9SS type B sorting domain-containing protein n=1 Tax=Tenacibaculum aquimarinum TaxID=2910675 RepID=UPI001F0A6B8D|nr:T9SS type B sorting domain-containing protein [Tenacibaculum aquimarinum]MCH3883344.1 T9SS type B sorting domain-containing protein [Tenacibaculum aquimarinum]